MGNKIDVLIVEDEPDIRESLQEILELEGVRAASAPNGLEALKYLKENQPKLILLDLLMPIMNGIEFRKNQALDSTIARVPVVLMSADNSTQEKARQLNVNFIKKPIELDSLLSTVRHYCQ
jgi:CheY-like chemotaxis protein